VGSGALAANTTGIQNTAIGFQTLKLNTTGGASVAVGYGALNVNTTGGRNTAIGQFSLQASTTVSDNTAVGYQSMYSNTTGDGQAFGAYALYSQTTGSNNTAVGATTLYANTTGVNNAGVGLASLRFNTTGGGNTAIGISALQANTTASNNTAVGFQAGYSNTTGVQLTAVGYQAGINSTGSYGTFFGAQAGSASTGTYNTCVGWASGYLITSGAKNTVIGAYSGNQGGLDIRTASNYIVLSDGDGNPRLISDNNGLVKINTSDVGVVTRLQIVYTGGGAQYGIGLKPVNDTTTAISFLNAAATQIGSISQTTSATAYNTSSDYRLKENVAPMTGALDVVQALKPVTYNWKIDGSSSQGFIAHELAEVCPDCVTGEKDAVDEDGKPKYQGIDTSFLIATLTAAIQELKAEIDLLKGAK
jgi:hypothetical protein